MSDQVDHDAPPEPSGVRAGERRFWAAVVDVLVLPWVLGLGARALVTGGAYATALGVLVAVPLLVAIEARSGRTPGKALAGVRTQRAGGGSVGWRRAAQRRWWLVLPAVELVPGIPTGPGRLLFAAVLGGLLVSIGRSSDGRGWHDRLAGTEVVAVDSPRRSRPLVVSGVVGALLMVAAGWWWHTPDGGSSSFSALPDAERIDCDVTHDGWLYPHQQRTVTLEPAQGPFVGRFGPHDVTLAFVDDTDAGGRRRGLEVQVATRSLGMTTGRSVGSDTQIVRTKTGPGLGKLTVRCQAPHRDAD